MSRTRDGAAGVRPWLAWLGVSFAAGVAAVAGSYLLVGRRPTFVATPMDRIVLALSPDALVAFAITQLGGVGQQLAFVSAVALTCGLLAVAALPGVLALREGRLVAAVFLGTVLPGLGTFALTLSAISGVGAGVGAGVVLLLTVGVADHPKTAESTAGSVARRRVLGAFGSAIGLSALGLLVRGTDEESSPSGVDIPEDARPEVRELLSLAADRSLDVEGLEPLVSTDFYEVDINSVNPDEARDGWTLSVTGAVETEMEYDFDAVERMAFEDRFVTLRCVGDQLNGGQMDNALWGGVPADVLLEDANPRGDRVILRGADGYYNEFPLDALSGGLFAYRMNGRPLPRGHGFPLRALVPGHWGEINVKWLTEIEVRDEDTRGYWEYRGWQGTGEVVTVAKLWRVNHLDGGHVEVAGHAYAGTRGIEAVEVSTDGGENWDEAELSDPLPGDDVWRQWRHVYDAVRSHEVVVRARDGNGDIQPADEAGPRPDGATGWVSETVEPR